jgi:hypothetical protein
VAVYDVGQHQTMPRFVLVFFNIRRIEMKLSAPKNITWWIAVVVGVLGFIGNFVAIPVIGSLSFWLLFIGFALLAVATIIKGL